MDSSVRATRDRVSLRCGAREEPVGAEDHVGLVALRGEGLERGHVRLGREVPVREEQRSKAERWPQRLA